MNKSLPANQHLQPTVCRESGGEYISGGSGAAPLAGAGRAARRRSPSTAQILQGARLKYGRALANLAKR